MTTPQKTNETTSASTRAEIFVDPVAYLARHGIEAELVAETTLPAAA